eukprot:Pompholyxophrys_punicea_v1_NODE_642_length_1538_cov_4.321645.p1 type:complete len:103 gc:universal NODE_642_length_1538_cov_4.321645:139-447(+)
MGLQITYVTKLRRIMNSGTFSNTDELNQILEGKKISQSKIGQYSKNHCENAFLKNFFLKNFHYLNEKKKMVQTFFFQKSANLEVVQQSAKFQKHFRKSYLFF